VAAKKQTSHRPYTGFDGVAAGITPGLDMLIRRLERETGRGLWNNGAYGVRDIRNKPGQPSVHSTGRAVDMSWRDMPDTRGKPNYRQEAQKVINTLVANADALGLELIIDYFPHPWGRSWMCTRNRWRKYDHRTVSGAPSGDWYHIEISPAMAANPQAMKAALDKAFVPNPPQP
jgi:hypothetical protein